MLEESLTVELLRRAKEGDKAAKERLLVENSSLLKSIVKRFLGRGVEYDDLFQLASIGFLKAIANFDEKFSVKFSTYAVPMIIGEIKRFLRDDGSVKVSRIIKSLGAKIRKYTESLKDKNMPEPTVEELSAVFGVEKEDVILAIGSSKQTVSIYERMNDDGNKPIEFIDTLESDETEDDLTDKLLLKDLIAGLSDREKRVIILRYYSDRTQSEVAKELGVSQVQVSRLETKIIEKMKRNIS
ncbi:MAG: SigB/SigF/SigG family RNA polymerase sigma factor [Clostridia bacterium]|nr:SigB/SigF/SigG family RNA polymerase sigma factor [Clostridia bacterium]